MRCGRHKTKRTVAARIVFVWLVSVGVSSPIAVMGYDDASNVYDARSRQCAPTSTKFVIYGSVLAFYVPLAINIVTYTLTIRILWRNQRKIMRLHSRSHHDFARTISTKASTVTATMRDQSIRKTTAYTGDMTMEAPITLPVTALNIRSTDTALATVTVVNGTAAGPTVSHAICNENDKCDVIKIIVGEMKNCDVNNADTAKATNECGFKSDNGRKLKHRSLVRANRNARCNLQILTPGTRRSEQQRQQETGQSLRWSIDLLTRSSRDKISDDFLAKKQVKSVAGDATKQNSCSSLYSYRQHNITANLLHYAAIVKSPFMYQNKLMDKLTLKTSSSLDDIRCLMKIEPHTAELYKPSSNTLKAFHSSKSITSHLNSSMPAKSNGLDLGLNSKAYPNGHSLLQTSAGTKCLPISSFSSTPKIDCAISFCPLTHDSAKHQANFTGVNVSVDTNGRDLMTNNLNECVLLKDNSLPISCQLKIQSENTAGDNNNADMIHTATEEYLEHLSNERRNLSSPSLSPEENVKVTQEINNGCRAQSSSHPSIFCQQSLQDSDDNAEDHALSASCPHFATSSSLHQLKGNNAKNTASAMKGNDVLPRQRLHSPVPHAKQTLQKALLRRISYQPAVWKRSLSRCIIASSGNRLLHHSRRSSHVCRAAKNERKALRVLGIIFVVFIMMWTPFFVINILAASHDEHTYPWLHSAPVAITAMWLGYLSSLANPLIYSVFSTHFRAAFYRIVSCRLHKRRMDGMTSASVAAMQMTYWATAGRRTTFPSSGPNVDCYAGNNYRHQSAAGEVKLNINHSRLTS